MRPRRSGFAHSSTQRTTSVAQSPLEAGGMGKQPHLTEQGSSKSSGFDHKDHVCRSREAVGCLAIWNSDLCVHHQKA